MNSSFIQNHFSQRWSTISECVKAATVFALCTALSACGGIVSSSGSPSGSGQPAVALSANSLTFGNQTVGTTSSAQSVTLTNTSSAMVNVTSIAVSGDYAETNNCGGSVSGGASCTISATFAPKTTGTLTGSISVTDNATGSPQTMALTGAGMAAGQCGGVSTTCGPSSYTAPSTVSDPACGSPPCTITDAASTAPPESNPSSINIQTDTNFVHSSSGGISGTNKTAFFRCTGPGTFGGFYNKVTGDPATSSFRTPSGAAEPAFSVDKTQIVISSDAGNKHIVVPINLTNGNGWCDGANMQVFGSSAIVNGVVQTAINPSISGGEIHSSLSVDKIWYGYSSPETLPSLVEYNASTNPGTLSTLIADINVTCGLAAGTIPTGGGGWFPSIDMTGGPYAIGQGKDTVLASYKGPQNTALWAVGIQRTGADGANPGCKWYRLDTDVAGANNWAGSTSASCTGCLGFKGSGLHAVELSLDGTTLELAETKSDNTQHVVFWVFASNVFTDATNVAGSGHRTWGFNQMFVTPSSPSLVQGVKLPNPNTIINFGAKIGATDSHISYMNSNATNDNCMFADSYVGVATQGSCTDSSLPGQNEITMIRTDQACAGLSPPARCTDGTFALTYRFMKNHSNGCAAGGYFYYTPRGNVSRDGTWGYFNSNWNEGLGLSSNSVGDCNQSPGYGPCKRMDVFFVELR
jgi:hypothetical protein